MQNLVVFIEPSEDASNISAKAGNLYLNRFCIDEDAACELSGVYPLKSEEPLNFTLSPYRKGEAIYSFDKTRTHDLDVINLEPEEPKIEN